MDRRAELGRFLAAKRARVSVEEVRLPARGGHRRVPGLRRDEVAVLAGISQAYYTKLERGKVGGISDSVLAGLTDALLLTPEEAAYVASVITVTGRARSPHDRAPDDAVSEPLQRIIDAAAVPIHVLNERCDIVASNRLGRALYPHHFEDPARPLNTVRFLFEDPRARSFFVDWQRLAVQGVAYLRASSARNPRDARLGALIQDLSSRSAEFAHMWATHDVQFDLVGVRSIEHPAVGRLDVEYQGLIVIGQQQLRVMGYSAAAGSPTAERLAPLAEMSAENHSDVGSSREAVDVVEP